jgi:hypothetical protein
VAVLEKGLQEVGIEIAGEGLALAWRPTPEELEQVVAFGERVLQGTNPDS